ncbi:MAG: efflux RND transporter periplasmic adaptor subunit [Bacteroidia bacterium]|jgi:membrane fusion protein (multidrug efflux system)
MTTKKVIRYSILAIVLAVLVWYKWSQTDKSPAPAKGGGGKNQPVQVSVVTVAPRDIQEHIKTTGTLLAMESIDLVAETAGRITQINFSEGSRVEKGQLLIKINDTELRAQLKRAMASQRMKDETEKRNKQLLTRGAISQEAYETAVSELEATNADVELIREQMRKTSIIAPFSGVIGLRYVSEGSYVNNATRMASLHTLDPVKIEFPVPERYASRIKVGSVCTFTAEGQTEVLVATVYAIEPSVDQATRTVMMRARCSNNKGMLIPGGFVQLNLPLGKQTEVLMVPTQSLVPILKGKKIYMVQGDSIVERVVKTGIRQDALIEITEGLQAGDRVVTEGVMYVKAGSKVIIKSGGK